MADINSNLPIKTLNDGAGQLADVTVGLLDSADIRISPALEGGNLATLAGKDFSTAAKQDDQSALLTTIDADTSALAAVDFSTAAKQDAQTAILTTIDADTSVLAAVDFSTAALQTAGNASLSSVDGKLNSLGQKSMANSMPVVLASDQSTLNVNVVSQVATAPVADFNRAIAIAAASSSTHTYTPATAFVLDNIQASASGRLRVEVKIGPAGLEETKWVDFNSAANPKVFIDASGYTVAAGDNILVIRQNEEVTKPQDLYSTIVGNL
jgi:hypothetical protein